ECARCVVNRGAQSRPVSDVDDDTTDITALGLELGDCPIEAGVVDVEQSHARPVVGHGLGIREADTAGAPCDDGSKVFYVEQFANFHLAIPRAMTEFAGPSRPEAR